MHDPYYDTDPYESVFSKMDVIGNMAGGNDYRDRHLLAIAAVDWQWPRGGQCPRCGRVGSSCKASYCVYG